MGKWLDLGLSFDDTVKHMVGLGIREGLAELILLMEQGKSTGDIVEDEIPKGARDGVYHTGNK